MALIHPKTFRGATFKGAYYILDALTINYAQRRVSVTVGVYVSQAAHADGHAAVDSMGLTLDGALWSQFWTRLRVGDTPHQAIYRYLKQRPEFTGATEQIETEST